MILLYHQVLERIMAIFNLRIPYILTGTFIHLHIYLPQHTAFISAPICTHMKIAFGP